MLVPSVANQVRCTNFLSIYLICRFSARLRGRIQQQNYESSVDDLEGFTMFPHVFLDDIVKEGINGAADYFSQNMMADSSLRLSRPEFHIAIKVYYLHVVVLQVQALLYKHGKVILD